MMFSDIDGDRLELEIQRTISDFHSHCEEGFRLKDALRETLSAQFQHSALGPRICQEYRNSARILVGEISSIILLLRDAISRLEFFLREIGELEETKTGNLRSLQAAWYVAEAGFPELNSGPVADELDLLLSLRSEIKAAVDDARLRLSSLSREIECLATHHPKIIRYIPTGCHTEQTFRSRRGK